jgi:N-acetylglucosaminyl-diphospho-decaprenol L-rhamnosyltransferase
MTSDAGQTPDLSVIVVTHNRLELALRTLRCARAAAQRLEVEWIVVDSGSETHTVEELRAQCPYARVLSEPNIGFAAANNRALAIARGRYLLLLNPDVEIVSGELSQLLGALDAQPQIGAASVIQRGPDGRLLLSIRRFPSPLRACGEAIAASRWTLLRNWREEESRPAAYAQQTPADWLVGAFLIVRRQALSQVGPLDERFFLYSEETDWCRRIAGAGWQVAHMPSMTVVHHTERTSRPDLLAQLSWAKVLFARKHRGALSALCIRGALALRHALRALAAHVRRQQPERASAEQHALAVVLGLCAPPFSTPERHAPGAKALR